MPAPTGSVRSVPSRTVSRPPLSKWEAEQRMDAYGERKGFFKKEEIAVYDDGYAGVLKDIKARNHSSLLLSFW